MPSAHGVVVPVRWPKFLTRTVVVGPEPTFIDSVWRSRTADYTGAPSFECVCGNAEVLIPVVFDDDTREIGSYINTGLCTECGAAYTVPTADWEEVAQWAF